MQKIGSKLSKQDRNNKKVISSKSELSTISNQASHVEICFYCSVFELELTNHFMCKILRGPIFSILAILGPFLKVSGLN